MAESLTGTRPYRFDRVLMAYSLGIFIVTFFAVGLAMVYLVAALANLFIFLIIYRISHGPAAWLRWLYPLILMVPLHFEIELVGTVFHAGEVYDDLVRGWDKALFGSYLHRALPDALPGPFWRELFHLLYFAYYPLIMGSFIYLWRQGYRRTPANGASVSPEFLRFAFVLLATFCSYLAIFILFPVIGPLDDRYLRFDGIGVIGPFIDWLYAIGASNGGAFPSSHAGESVVVVLLLKRSGKTALMLWLLVLGLSLGTIYGSFHYAIDAAAGLASGGLLYLLWNGLYERWGPEGIPANPSST
jgi:hypothetical protein